MISIKENVFSTPHEVHVWRKGISQKVADARDFLKYLSPEEMKKAEALHLQSDQRLFVLTRGFLRKTLAEYCDVEPGQIGFTFGPFKKPQLDTMPGRLEFNLSHTEEEMVLAVALDRKVGVDVETVNSACSWEEMSKDVFSEEEMKELMELPEELRPDAFFKGWTQKEAFIKALGLGMYAPLKDYTFELDPRIRCGLLSARHSNVLSQWQIIGIKGIASHFCSIAVEHKEKLDLRFFGDSDAVYLES